LVFSDGVLLELVNFPMTAIALLRLPYLFLNDTTSSVSAEGVASTAKRQGMGSRLRRKRPSPCTKGLGGTTDKMGSRLGGNDREDGFPPMDGDAVFLPEELPSDWLKADDGEITV
jgi:hypothetical protein